MFAKKSQRWIASVLPFFMIFSAFYFVSQPVVNAGNAKPKKNSVDSEANDLLKKGIVFGGTCAAIATGAAIAAFAVPAGLFSLMGLAVAGTVTFLGYGIAKLIAGAVDLGESHKSRLEQAMEEIEGEHTIDPKGIGSEGIDDSLPE
ncbi:hypothetical protein ACFL35_11475 [Candidatus Riflebacteria bacterium]